MKTAIFLFFLLVLYATVAKAGLPPTTAAGQNQSNITTFNFKVPNNLATKVSGGTLLENGNSNILINPSFEHSSDGTGWNFSGTGTSAINGNSVIHGSRSAEISTTAQTINITQSSTLYQASFSDGVQGLASIRVKTTHTGTCSVCSIQAGTVSTTNCVSVTANNKWGLYKIPMILGATSNGISLACTSGTGLTYVDDAFVGAVNLSADVDQSRIAGVSYIPGTTNCIFRRTSTTLGVFSDINSVCPGPTILEQNMGSWQTTDANTPRQTINNLPAGKYRLSVSFTGGPASTQDASFALTDGATTCREHGVITTGVGQGVNVDCVFTYNSSGNRTFDLYGRSSTGSIDVYNQTGTGYSRDFVFTLQYLGSGSVYTSNNADTDWAACTPNSYNGIGSPTSVEVQCKREGGDLLMKGKLTFGTVSAAEARIGLPVWNGTQLTSAGTSIIPSIQQAGPHMASNNSATPAIYIMPLIEPSVTYFTMGGKQTTQSQLTKMNGNDYFSTGNTISFIARIPISGWTNSNLIIGSFSEVMTTPGITKPKTCYYAFGGASATLASPTVCSTGTCTEVVDSCGTGSAPAFSSTGVYADLTFANGTWANSSFLSCKCIGFSATTGTNTACDPYFVTPDQTWATNSSGGAVLNITARSAANLYGIIECSGQAP